MKSKIKAKLKSKAPVKRKPAKKIKTPAKTQPALAIDTSNLKWQRVEWFDDRFYKTWLPLNIDPVFLQTLPESYIKRNETELIAYLPSVTTIIPSPNLERWRGDVGNVNADRISYIAKTKGSIIHNAIDSMVNGATVIYQNLKIKNISDIEIKAYSKTTKKKVVILHEQEEMIQIARYTNLIRTLNATIVESEQVVTNIIGGYAGTLDQVWYLPGGEFQINSDRKVSRSIIEPGFYIVDFKTGKGYDADSTFEQLSALHGAHHRKESMQGVIGVHLNNDNKSGIQGVKLYIKMKDELQPYIDQFHRDRDTFYFKKQVFPSLFEFSQIISMEQKINKNLFEEILQTEIKN